MLSGSLEDISRIVVPHAGTWIEMLSGSLEDISRIVVPHAGTWIEIELYEYHKPTDTSFPTRERGLK